MHEAAATVDARDMLCAQALAQADQAMRRLAAGAVLAVRCNAPDVQRDLLSWAADRGHAVLGVEEEADGVCIRLRRGAG